MFELLLESLRSRIGLLHYLDCIIQSTIVPTMPTVIARAAPKAVSIVISGTGSRPTSFFACAISLKHRFSTHAWSELLKGQRPPFGKTEYARGFLKQ